MGHKAKDLIQRKRVFVTKRRVSGTREVLVKSSFPWGILMVMWENALRVLKVCMREIVLGKKVHKEEDSWSYVMKKSCGWQTHVFQGREMENHLQRGWI